MQDEIQLPLFPLNLWQLGPHGTKYPISKEQVSIRSLMGLHLQRQNKQKMGGEKVNVITRVWYSQASAALT